MTDLEHILPLWHELETAGADYVLATIVAVEGPSYRKPGARTLLSQDGRRAGTVSGGCLEAEVAKRAWWLTESGPVVERYSTAEDDGDMPYGSGCGGVVYLLLERRATASPLLTALEHAFRQREPLAIATILEGSLIGARAFTGSAQLQATTDRLNAESACRALALVDMSDLAFARKASFDERDMIGGTPTRVFGDYRAARPGLWVFGAGDDAKPLVHLTRELGWFVAVADGRSHLATRNRFTAANDVLVLPISELPNAADTHFTQRMLPTDAAVLISHSFEQDSRILASILSNSRIYPLAYLGVLGPQRRTLEVLAEAARILDLPSPSDRAERWLTQLHAPTGLDLGSETPASIALSILAEIQQTLAGATAKPLRQVRALPLSITER